MMRIPSRVDPAPGAAPVRGLFGVAVVAAFAAAGLAASPLGAQEEGEMEGDTVELVFEREVFHYPEFERRNPFQELTGDDAGPRFENLVLFGILQSGGAGGSVALFGVSQGGEPVAGQMHRLREGDRIGNSRVLEIRERQVLLEVEEFGLVETRTIELERALPQPSPPAEDTVGETPPDEPEEEESDTLEIGFDRNRSEPGLTDDRRNGNGGWS